MSGRKVCDRAIVTRRNSRLTIQLAGVIIKETVSAFDWQNSPVMTARPVNMRQAGFFYGISP